MIFHTLLYFFLNIYNAKPTPIYVYAHICVSLVGIVLTYIGLEAKSKEKNYGNAKVPV